MTKDEFIEKYSGKHYGDAKSLENKLADLAGFAYEALKFKGSDTAANVDAISDPVHNETWKIATTGGTVGTLTTTVGDVVCYDSVAADWVFVIDVT